MKYGNMGVEIFLLCSGICLYFSFVKNSDIIAFLQKRLSRLFWPVVIIDGAYWVYLCIISADGNGWPDFFERITLLKFWLSGDQQIWFVSLILVCYLLYPYIYSAFFSEAREKKAGWARCLLLILIAVSFTVLLMMSHPDVYDRVEIALTRLPVFILGCYLGRYVYEKRQLPRWSVAVIIAIDILSLAVLEQGVLHGIWKRYFYLFGGVALTFTIPAVLKFLNCKTINRICAFFGKISLNLYLSHIMVIRLYKMTEFYDGKRVIHYLVVLALSILVAWAAEQIIVGIKKWRKI